MKISFIFQCNLSHLKIIRELSVPFTENRLELSKESVEININWCIIWNILGERDIFARDKKFTDRHNGTKIIKMYTNHTVLSSVYDFFYREQNKKKDYPLL